MTFWIQASSPRVVKQRSQGDETLCDAAETIFALESECAYINWNHIHVPMSYKYDIGVMSDDIIAMLQALRSAAAGRHIVEWASNTFSAQWRLDWNDDLLAIASTWTSIMGKTEVQLNARPTIEIGKAAFRAEWSELLRRLDDGLRSAGYTGENLHGINRLSEEIATLPQRGVLYRD